MKKEAVKTKALKQIDLAAEVRKHKRRLNALTESERQELIESGLALIHNRVKTRRNVSGR